MKRHLTRKMTYFFYKNNEKEQRTKSKTVRKFKKKSHFPLFLTELKSLNSKLPRFNPPLLKRDITVRRFYHCDMCSRFPLPRKSSCVPRVELDVSLAASLPQQDKTLGRVTSDQVAEIRARDAPCIRVQPCVPGILVHSTGGGGPAPSY